MPKVDRNVSYGGRIDDAVVTDPKISMLQHRTLATDIRSFQTKHVSAGFNVPYLSKIAQQSIETVEGS
jgi:hypothetical protein